MTAAFAAEERFGLVNQMRRAAVSVASNIAEGSARISSKDQANFYQMAYSSCMEVLNQLLISYDLKFIDEARLNDCRSKIEIITGKLNFLGKVALS